MKRLTTLLVATLLLSPAMLFAQQPSADDGARMRGMGDMPGATPVAGTVTAVAADGVTVRSMDGEDFQVKAGANTRISHEREPAKLADVKVGDGVMAFGQADSADPKTVRAVFLAYQTAAEVKERMATFGKTWVAGRVKQVQGATVTLDTQQPGQTAAKSFTLTADESTSIKRQRESVTMGDIHPGDFLMARGSVKDGVFVPATLEVRSPHRMHGPPAGGPPAGKPPQ